MSGESKQLSATEAFNAIVARGDELDVMRRQSLIGRYVLLGSNILAGFMSMSGRKMPTLDALITYPPYVAAGGVAAMAAAMVSRKVYGAKIADRADWQEKVRADIGEVDVVRIGRGKKAEAHLRWYGLDDCQKPELASGKLRKVVEWSDEHGVKNISIGADWMKPETGSGTLETDFGTVYHGKYAQLTARKKRFHRLKTVDARCDDSVLVANLEQARALANNLEQRYDGSLMTALLEKADRPDLMAIFGDYRAGVVSDVEVINTLASAVQEGLDDFLTTDHHWNIDANGLGQYHSTITSYGVRGDAVYASIESSATSDDETFYVPPQLLTHFLKAEDIDDLMARIDRGEYEDDENMPLLCAAYLLALRDIDRKADVELAFTGAKPTQSFPTTLQKIHETQKRPQQEGLLRFSHTRTARAMAAAGLVVCTTVGGGVAGAGMRYSADYVYTSNINYNEYSEYVMARWLAENPRKTEKDAPVEVYAPLIDNEDGTTTQVYEDYIRQSFRRQLADRYVREHEKIADIDYKLGEQIAQVYIQKFGLRAGFLMNSAGMVDKEWLKRMRESQTLDPKLFAQSHELSRVGDSPGKSNAEIYRIKSLTGKSSRGFWYTDIHDTGRVEHHAGDIPEMRFGVYDSGGYKNTSLPYNLSEIITSNPDFQVDTPYIDGLSQDNAFGYRTGYTQLPLLENAVILGAAFIDADNPNIVVEPQLEKSKDGMYRVKLDQYTLRDMSAFGLRRPILRYWVKETGIGTQNHFDGDFRWVSTGRVDTQAVAAATKHALGLSINASDDEILKAIKENYAYSFTPFADQKRLDIPEYDRTDTQSVLTAMGIIMARLNAMNCNIASAQWMLATNAMNGKANQAVGYNEDGDGSIASKEAHAVIVTHQGNIIDPTPSGQKVIMPPLEKIQQSKLSGDPGSQEGGGSPTLPAVVAAALLLLGYRKRGVVKDGLTALEEKIVLQDPVAQAVLTEISRIRWGGVNAQISTGVRYRTQEEVKELIRDLSDKPPPTINEMRLPDQHHRIAAREILRYIQS